VLPEAPSDARGVRLNRVLALAGVASRRACDELIAAGRVQVAGQVITDLGHRVGGGVAAAAARAGLPPLPAAATNGRSPRQSPAGASASTAAPEVLVDGKPVAIGPALAALSGGGADSSSAPTATAARGRAQQLAATGAGPFFYFAVNKPKGYVCSAVSPSPGQTPAVELLRPWLDDWERRARREAAAREAAAAVGSGGGGSGRGRQARGGRAPTSSSSSSSPASSSSTPLLPPRLFTVGRLDVATTGLLLITNDGAWAQAVQHPAAGGLTREYVAALRTPATSAQLQALATDGAVIDGARVVPLAVSAERVGGTGPGGRGGRPAVRVVVGEGRNREVRRLVEAAGLELHALKRVRLGGYRMPSSLGLGGWVELGAEARAAVLRDPEAAAAREARRLAVGRGGGGY
jgi:pseudouridine synthase